MHVAVGAREMPEQLVMSGDDVLRDASVTRRRIRGLSRLAGSTEAIGMKEEGCFLDRFWRYV